MNDRMARLSAADFRGIALGMKGTVESAHMGHPDFRAHGRIFAKLHADGTAGMVKLTTEQQGAFLKDHPAAFSPESGAWGRQGCTRVRLDAVDEETLGEATTLAWQNAASKPSSRPPTHARSARARRPGSRT
jgi:hypothetical protein